MSAVDEALRLANQKATTQDGRSIAVLSDQQPVLLIFLRHGGCTFCRQALADLAKQRSQLEADGILPVVVFMQSSPTDSALLTKYGLKDLLVVADPACELYQAYQLQKLKVKQMFSPSVFFKGFRAAILKGHGFGKVCGDIWQLSGVFLIHRGEILAAHVHRDAADRTDYCELVDSQVKG